MCVEDLFLQIQSQAYVLSTKDIYAPTVSTLDDIATFKALLSHYYQF